MAGYQGTATREDPQEALASVPEAERRDALTSVRGRMISYDTKTQTGKIKPLLKQKFGDEILEAPDLEQVPVRQPRGGGIAFHKPLKKGDEVDLHFAMRALDPYQEDGESFDGHPGRMNHLTDAVAYPSGSSSKTVMKGLPEDRMHLGTEDGKSGFQMKENGTFDIKKGDDTLLKLIGDFIQQYMDHHNEGLALDEKAAAGKLLDRLKAMKAS